MGPAVQGSTRDIIQLGENPTAPLMRTVISTLQTQESIRENGKCTPGSESIAVQGCLALLSALKMAPPVLSRQRQKNLA